MNSSKTPIQKIWLIGASSGIGLALCKRLLAQGHCVVASSRQAQSSLELLALQKTYTNNLQCLNLDVHSLIKKPQQLSECCAQAWQAFGGLDIWIYNVGAYQPMSIDVWQLDAFVEMNHSNYLGAVALMIGLKPYFLEQGHGHWFWNISLASDFGLPYGGAYSAPKAALMNLAESLQPELKQHHIYLRVINHGFVKTRLTAKNDFPMLGLMDANTAAQKIYHAMQNANHTCAQATGRFEIRFPWSLSFILATLKRLPKSWSLALTQKMLRKPH